MAFDAKEQRRIMGLFATGVTVITTRVGEQLWGMTANAVCSLSLDPPLILFAVDRKGASYQVFSQCDFFAVNILTAEQDAISQRYAMPGPKDFTGLAIKTAVTGAPILADCLAYVDCRRAGVLSGGDHDIFLGEIVAGEAGEGEPLLYFRGKYARLAK